jgi:ribosome-associated translation inhibitor RaiA
MQTVSDHLTEAVKAAEPEGFEANMLAAVKSNFMTLQVNVSQWNGRVTDNKLAKEAAKQQGMTNTKVSSTFPIYGRSQGDFDEIRQLFTAIREHLYKESHCFADPAQTQKSGDRLVSVTKVIALTGQLKLMATEAEDKLNEFVANYDNHLTASKIALGMDVFNRLSKQTDKMGRGRIPTANELATRFRCKVQTPQPLALHDVEDIKRLMANSGAPDIGFAVEVAKSSFAKIKDQILVAQDEAVDSLAAALDTINRQLTAKLPDNKHGAPQTARLSPALLANAKRAVEQVRELAPTMGSPSDLEAVLQEVEAKVTNVTDVQQWRHSTRNQRSATEASVKLAKQLEKLKERNHKTLEVTGVGFEIEELEEY